MSDNAASLTREQAIGAMIALGRELAAIQDPGVRDATGFSNSDVSIGRALASIVEHDPADEAMVTRLAMMVSVAYNKQAAGMVSPETLRAIHQLISTSDRVGGGGPSKLSAKDREAVRSAVIISSDDFGGLYFSFQNNSKLLAVCVKHGGIRWNVDGDWRYQVANRDLVQAIADLKEAGARVYGEQLLSTVDLTLGHADKLKVEEIDAEWLGLKGKYNASMGSIMKSFGRDNAIWFRDGSKRWNVRKSIVPALIEDLRAAGIDTRMLAPFAVKVVAAPDFDRAKIVRGGARFDITVHRTNAELSFEYNAHVVAIVKDTTGRRFNAERKSWEVPLSELAGIVTAIDSLDSRVTRHYDFSELRRIAAIHAPAPIEQRKIRPEIAEQLRDYQIKGTEFIAQPLDELRRKYREPRLRGLAVGDEMGLGKSAQSAIAADLLTQENPRARTVIVTKAAVKRGFANEIRRWVGPNETINILGGDKKTQVDPSARWTVLNWDIVDDYAQDLREAGIDVLILDEAHEAAHFTAKRTRAVVGAFDPVGPLVEVLPGMRLRQFIPPKEPA
jgi:hypothetical protein